MNDLLQQISGPEDLRKLRRDQLPQLAEQIRQRVLHTVSRNGGHLASNLGVVELTIALHWCLNLPEDRIIFDVGHQCYPHKLLTGRAARFETLRQAGGISGFPSPAESEYDPFFVGHAGTAIPTALGLAKGDQLSGRLNRVAAVVGDASIVNGVAFEGLNLVGTLDRQFMVVLNDNSMGIAKTQGSMADYLAKFRVSHAYEETKRRARQVLDRVPVLGKPVFNALEHLRLGLKATLVPNQIFEHLGLVYIGPIDGHDVGHLIDLIEFLKDVQLPVLLHVHTHKGHGCRGAEDEPTAFHSPSPFDIGPDGKLQLKPKTGKSFTSAFADALIEAAREDEKVVALTAAMPDGTGLARFAEVFPDRCVDVGLAESATVDVAAGMARTGLKPVVAIYSTFMQRAYDQVFQEVSLQNLPVILCMDRAGLVGGDGAVHHGFTDIATLRTLPRMVLLAPADEPEMHAAMRFALGSGLPCAIRYPRDLLPAPLAETTAPFELGRGVRLRSGEDITILAYGMEAVFAMQAARLLAARGIEATVWNARFAQPLDEAMLTDAFGRGGAVLTVEDHGLAGGFGSAVLERAAELGLPVDMRRFRRLGIPSQQYVPHGSRAWQLRQVGIDADGVAAAAADLLGAGGAPPRKTRPASAEPARQA